MAVCEALLIYTSLQQSTGGIAMALAERHGEFQQLCDVAARDFDPERLKAKLLSFAEQAKRWREVMLDGMDWASSQ